MTPFSANPVVYIFSAVAIGAMVLYFGWGAIDRMGLREEEGSAVVTGKQYNPPGTTYRTTIAAGRAWTMTDATSDSYVLTLNLEQAAGPVPTVALVSQALFEAVQTGDKLHVSFRHTRLTKQLQVIAVSR